MKKTLATRRAQGVKRVLAAGAVSVSLVAAIGMGAYAVPEAPSDGSRNGGGLSAPGGSPDGSATNVSYTGAIEYAYDASENDRAYSSETGGENAILVSGGDVKLSDITVEKTGDESSESSDFYGTNAGILVYNGGKLSLSDSTVRTIGGHANAVFSYGSGSVALNDVKITTSGNNSGGVMVTGGGTLTAENVTVETAGNSAAAIRSDRGGGTMTINGGTYRTTGVGSPAIYSTAEVSTKGAELEAAASEGVVIEGANSVTIEDTKLTDTNTTLNGNSETYKNIFIYQSMSGDADEGLGTFTAKNSEITTNKGDVFFITNTAAVINLENNTYVSDGDGVFLRAQAGKWGTAGENGGRVTLYLANDEVRGDMELDDISELSVELSQGSYLRGKIAGKTSMTIKDKASVWVLEGDVDLAFLDNADESFQNIYSNGYHLTVNGETVSVNTDTPPEHKAGYVDETATVEVVAEPEKTSGLEPWMIAAMIGGGVAAVIAVVAIVVLRRRSKRKKESTIKVTLSEEEKNGFRPAPGQGTNPMGFSDDVQDEVNNVNRYGGPQNGGQV